MACTVGSCTESERSRGGLMLVVSREGSLPIGRLDVSVTAKGVVVLARSYRVPEEAQLPTTIALVSNGDPTAQATLSITGWEIVAGQPDVPLDRRDAIVTQIPADRVAEFKVVLTARCSKWVDGSGQPACQPPGYTCDSSNGDCIPPDVVATDLPTYSADDEPGVGGATASGGRSAVAGAATGHGGSSDGDRGDGGAGGEGGATGDGGASGDDGEGGVGGDDSVSENGGAAVGGQGSGGLATGGSGGIGLATGGSDGVGLATGGSGGIGLATGGSGGVGVTQGGTGGVARICGDGKLDANEGCDDGNALTGDGCAACAVESGFSCDNTNPPSKCADVDECLHTPCSVNAKCTNSTGSYSCACNAGYVGNGWSCTRPSCSGLGDACKQDDCCTSRNVDPGTFKLGGGSGTTSATIAAFALDEYEVTVARFRAFLNSYTAPPKAGAGAHPLIAGSGWQTAWNSNVPDQATILGHILLCDSTYRTWQVSSGTTDQLPMNCVSWYEAFAFCAWDNGRLPTEAEWEYAAAGGAEQRVYPWGDSPVPDNGWSIARDYANYYGLGDGSIPGVFAFTDLLPVGSKPAGQGRYGQFDLAGSVWEWTLDGYATPYPSKCDNCANLSATSTRVVRGGGWYDQAAYLTVATRNDLAPTTRHYDYGFRCAR
ncbi:MAG TPA: SUMF1/EgtB/PvdO family nonheme iron enzyme [Polyangiaceae bacterium]|nr:SUMF1/EgtB/PvdO family nonheme iron enzyme [Polyangiaceae bacterium]